MLCDRDPETGEALASQPTLSRFENAVGPREVVRALRAFEQGAIERLAQRHPEARRVVIDVDATVDEAHGQQSFCFFNAFDDAHCFLPLLGFLTVDGHPEQHLFSARLRPGIGAGRRGLIRSCADRSGTCAGYCPGPRSSCAWTGASSAPACSTPWRICGCSTCSGCPRIRPTRRSRRFLRGLRGSVRKSKAAARRYGSLSYKARKWSRERRVVVKAEVLPPPPTAKKRGTKVNMRYVVTNLKTTPRHVYESVYCGRGDSENRIKELKNDLQMDRTSCSLFTANQLRVLMTSAAYVLYQELRGHMAASELARAQVHTLRLKLVKISTQVVRSVRRIVLRMPRSCPSAPLWCKLARQLHTVGSG